MSTQDHLPFAFDLADRTIPAMLTKQAERFGDKRLVVCGDVTWSYREAARVAARVAGTLRRAGIGFGDRIGLMCGNRVENLALFLAAGWIGAITVPINTASKGPQIAYYLKNSAARLFVVEAEYLPLLDQADLAGTRIAVTSFATAPVQAGPMIMCGLGVPPDRRRPGPAADAPPRDAAVRPTAR